MTESGVMCEMIQKQEWWKEEPHIDLCHRYLCGNAIPSYFKEVNDQKRRKCKCSVKVMRNTTLLQNYQSYLFFLILSQFSGKEIIGMVGHCSHMPVVIWVGSWLLQIH